MSWDYFKDKTGKTFIVNWVGVRALIRSYLHSKLMWENSRTMTDANWFGPDVYYTQTDFKRVRSQKECLTEVLLREFYDTALNSMNMATQMLEQILAETREYDVQFTKENKQAADRTMYNIDQSVWRGEIAADAFAAVRNVSAEALLVGATFIPGPGKYAALGAGSVLKGVGKYQDSGKFYAGLAEAAFSFGFGVAGLKVIPKNASAAQTVTLNIYLSLGQNFVGEPAKAWVGGEDVSNALVSGSIKAGAAPLSELIREQLSPGAIQKLFNTNGKLKAMALPLQVGMTLLSDKSVAAIVDKAKVNSPPPSLPKQAKEELLDTALLDKRFIQSAAVKVYN